MKIARLALAAVLAGALLCAGLPAAPRHKATEAEESLQANVQTGYLVKMDDDDDTDGATAQPALEQQPFKAPEQQQLQQQPKAPEPQMQEEPSRLGFLGRLLFSQKFDDNNQAGESGYLNSTTEGGGYASAGQLGNAVGGWTGLGTMDDKKQGIVNTVQQGLSYMLGMNQAIISSVQSGASSGALFGNQDASSQVEPNAPYSSFGKDSKDQSSGPSSYAGGPFNALTISSSDSSLGLKQGVTAADGSKSKLDRIKAQGYGTSFGAESLLNNGSPDSSTSSVGSGGDWGGYRYTREQVYAGGYPGGLERNTQGAVTGFTGHKEWKPETKDENGKTVKEGTWE